MVSQQYSSLCKTWPQIIIESNVQPSYACLYPTDVCECCVDSSSELGIIMALIP